MLGYDHIRNMPDTQISRIFQVSIEEAVRIRNSTLEEMTLHPEVCPGRLGIRATCHDQVTGCNQCRKEFLENELSL